MKSKYIVVLSEEDYQGRCLDYTTICKTNWFFIAWHYANKDYGRFRETKKVYDRKGNMRYSVKR